jgi:hypothetical protein
VVPPHAEGHELDLGEGAPLRKQLKELLFGDVIQDHRPVQRSGHQVRTDHGRVDGLEDAMRPYERWSIDASVASVQQKGRSFVFAKGLDSASSYAQKA